MIDYGLIIYTKIKAVIALRLKMSTPDKVVYEIIGDPKENGVEGWYDIGGAYGGRRMERDARGKETKEDNWERQCTGRPYT